MYLPGSRVQKIDEDLRGSAVATGQPVEERALGREVPALFTAAAVGGTCRAGVSVEVPFNGVRDAERWVCAGQPPFFTEAALHAGLGVLAHGR
ncbi:hypothetical protein DEM27_12455 [Metarhizobium album]|uniref:Uncharacterized protein n=1 Tax=Metarhizobium album TaxID=2182425 RepID=A0A2U2DSH0_9HYPH|nr:hypothetical protein DEM27_12455 [Rhizobium album]